MAPQPSLHDRLVRSIAEGAPEAASLAREQARQIGTVYRQMEAVVRGGEAAPPFLQGASEALQAMDSYLKALQRAVEAPEYLPALVLAHAHMVQAQRALSQAHYRALAALALNLDPVPRHLQDLRHLILARMEGLLDRERFRSGIHTLLEHYRRAYQQLLDADRMASRWQAQHQEDLGEIMRSLEEAYLGGMDCLESLLEGGVAEAEALWPRLVSSFRSIQETRRQIARLEERLGPIDFLEPDPFSY